MARIGTMELIVVVIVALFAIGPERLPRAARMLGQAVSAFKKCMNDATGELREVSGDFKEVTDELANAQKDMQRAIIEADEEIRQPLNGAKKEPAPESAQGQPVQAVQTGAAVAQSAEEVAQTTVA